MINGVGTWVMRFYWEARVDKESLNGMIHFKALSYQILETEYYSFPSLIISFRPWHKKRCDMRRKPLESQSLAFTLSHIPYSILSHSHSHPHSKTSKPTPTPTRRKESETGVFVFIYSFDFSSNKKLYRWNQMTSESPFPINTSLSYQILCILHTLYTYTYIHLI